MGGRGGSTINKKRTIEKRAEVELHEHQRQHFCECSRFLGLDPSYEGFTSRCIINNSSTGCGKTIVNSLLAAKVNPESVYIFGNTSCERAWDKTLPQVSLDEVAEFYSYASLPPSKKTGLAKHGLLKEDPNSDKAKGYKITKKFKQMLDKPTVLIFDEAHALKNFDSGQTQAAWMLSNAILNGYSEPDRDEDNRIKRDDKGKPIMRRYYNEHSRVFYITADLTDDPAKEYVWLAHLGIMKRLEPYTSTRVGLGEVEYHTEGIESVYEWLSDNRAFLESIAPDIKFEELKTEFEKALGTPNKYAKEYCEMVFDEIVKPIYMHSMPNIKEAKLLAYTLLSRELHTPEEQHRLDHLMEDKKIADMVAGKGYMAKISAILRETQFEKSKLVARLFDLYLKDKTMKHHKFIVKFRYHQALENFLQEMIRLGHDRDSIVVIAPHEMVDGKKKVISIPNRNKRIARFQEFNDRVRIAAVTNVANTSIDLDDKSPNKKYPRISLCPVSYETINDSQFSGRAHRNTTTSNTTFILLMYTLDEMVVDRHRVKSQILSGMSRSGAKAITNNTPFVRFDLVTQKYVMYTVKPGTKEIDRVLMPDVPIFKFNEEMYEKYRETNPIDTTGAKMEKNGNVFKIEYSYTRKGKKKQDVLTVATDLEIDSQHYIHFDQAELKYEIELFYHIFRLKGGKIKKIIDVREASDEDEIDYYYPGFRVPLREASSEDERVDE